MRGDVLWLWIGCCFIKFSVCAFMCYFLISIISMNWFPVLFSGYCHDWLIDWWPNCPRFSQWVPPQADMSPSGSTSGTRSFRLTCVLLASFPSPGIIHSSKEPGFLWVVSGIKPRSGSIRPSLLDCHFSQAPWGDRAGQCVYCVYSIDPNYEKLQCTESICSLSCICTILTW